MVSKLEFEIIEGRFHDGLGTYAEIVLANMLIKSSGLLQSPIDVSRSSNKMHEAINALPHGDLRRSIFEQEVKNIENAAILGAQELIRKLLHRTLVQIRHVPREYNNASAGDLRLECSDGYELPVSVKTDKSGRTAVAEGQTPDIWEKWSHRYFQVSQSEFIEMMVGLGFSTPGNLKTHYLNVARLMANILISKLGLEDCQPNDFSAARVTNLPAIKYLFKQLLLFKSGRDESHVIIFERSTGNLKWESILDSIDIEGLTSDRVSFRPARPRPPQSISSEFGVKVDGKVVVSFQVKHKRGALRDTNRKTEFSDITTRLFI